ncbi:MAG: hypothetical protein AB7S26_27045 [Sandaracinaceae bacterium]
MLWLVFASDEPSTLREIERALAELLVASPVALRSLDAAALADDVARAVELGLRPVLAVECDDAFIVSLRDACRARGVDPEPITRLRRDHSPNPAAKKRDHAECRLPFTMAELIRLVSRAGGAWQLDSP